MTRNLRYILLMIILLMAPLTGRAGDKERFCLTGGLEWGYSLSSTLYSHYNFLAKSGIRVNVTDDTLNADSNGFINACFGARFLKKYSLAVIGGYYGLQSDRRSTVISARASYYFNDYLSDSFILYLEGGRGLAATFQDRGIWLAKIGGSYQFHLSNWMNLFISLSFQAATDHPAEYYDTIGKASVTPPDLLRSDTYYGAANVSIGLNF